MANAELFIELDDGPYEDVEFKDYRVLGELVSGYVTVTVDEPISFRKLQIFLSWHTEGRGDKDRKVCDKLIVPEGELMTGDSRHQFSFRLPEKPISYAGHYINFVWEISAELDLAWKRDPKTNKVFYTVLP